MLNIIKMDLYRMFRTKSLYVVWIVAAVAIIITTGLSKADYEMTEQEAAAAQEEMAGSESQEQVQLGIAVMLPTEPGDKVTVSDVFYANTQAKFIALFLVIFVVIFATADINSGYIKNIGGQVKNRGSLILAKAVSLFVYTVFSMVGIIIMQAVSNQFILGYVVWGKGRELLLYTGTQILLHFALAIICMAVAVILRSNLISMVIAICLCMNMMIVLYSAADNLIRKAGVNNFQLIKYTVTGKIAMLPMRPTGSECMEAAAVAVGFIVVMTVVSSVVFRKRDI